MGKVIHVNFKQNQNKPNGIIYPSEELPPELEAVIKEESAKIRRRAERDRQAFSRKLDGIFEDARKKMNVKINTIFENLRKK